jgi:hypothetical protein
MPSQISITNIYELLGKSGAGSVGDNMSLADCVIGTAPDVDPLNVDSAYNVVGNAWGYNPTGDNTISMGNISDWSTPFSNNSLPQMRFKFSPPADIAADLYGDNTSYPRTFPFNKGELGVKMNNTNVGDGGIAGTYDYDVNSYTTWTSVAVGDSYKFPSANSTSATICMWIKPVTPSTARNFIWADIVSIGTVNPYRGWWAQYNTNNTIGFNRGDGTGGAASDRYSFTGSATFDGSGDYWQFLAFLVSNDENTVSTGTNYMWAYVWNGRSYAWSNGATYLSGSGGAMAWSSDSGTETTSCMANNPLGNTSNGLDYDMGHFYVFNGELSTTQVEYVRELTDDYTV